MATDVGIRLGVDGEKEFRSALAGVNSQIKNLNSEMKTVVSSMSGMNSAEDAAAKKNDVLARSVTAVKQKISLISGEYDRAKGRLAELGTALENAKQEFGENSDEALRAQKAYNKQAKTVNDLGTQLNNATADLNRMENEMNDLGDSTDDTADALDSAGNSALSFGDILKANVLSQAIVSGVKALAGAVRDMVGDFIESAANVQAEASQFTQTFGDMGDTASAAIGRVASSSGILDTRLNTLGSQIYAFARASGGDAAESMSLMETALQATADSAAYYDRSLEDTADSLQSFLKGNYENDAALGLSATETTRNAAAMDKFSKKFNDLTEIQKQQTLLQMVVDAQKLSGAMGQASREADGWENVQGNLNESWRQFMAAAGTPALQAVIPVIQSVTGSLAGLTDALKSGGVSGLLAQLAEQFTGAVQSIGAAAPGLLQAGSTVMQSVADGIAAALPTLSATMQQVFTSLTGFIAAVLPALIPMGVDAVSALLSSITSALPLLVTAAQEIFSSLGGYLAANLPALVQKGMEALSGFASGLRTNVGLLVDIGIDLVQNLATGIVNSIPTLIQTVPEIVTNIAGIINDNAPKLVIAAAELIGKLAMGLIQAMPTLVANIPQIIQAIVSVFTAFNWINLGQTIITMLKNGIMAMVGAVQGAATNVLNAINSGLQALPGKMLELGRQGITGLINGIKALISSIAGVMSSIAQAIVSGVRSLPSQLLSIGRQIIQGLINGIRSGISGVVSAIGNVVSSAVSKAKSALGKPFDNLIYDRTAADVSRVTDLTRKMRSGTASDAERTEWLEGRMKGAWNASDLNRIENWTIYLTDFLAQQGYTANTFLRRTAWTKADFPTRSDIGRIRRNVEALQNYFFALPDWREIVHNGTMNFDQANVLEWDLGRIEIWLQELVKAANIRQANTLFMQAGGVFNA